MNWRLVLSFRSQFFHSRLHFSSQANDRSTIQRLGITSKLCRALRLTTCTVAPMRSSTDMAKFSPLYPASTNMSFTLRSSRLASFKASNAPSRSVTSAVVTAKAWGKPWVSTAIWRFIPDTFLPASYPFSSVLSVFFTLCASTMQKVVVFLLPRLLRTSPTDFF